MSIFGVNNPGIGGLDELTTAEELVIQTLAVLGTPFQTLGVNAGGTGVAYLNTAPRGTLPISTTGGTTTLTATQFQNMAFDVTGTLTSNAIIEIPDNFSQMFVVDNATTGAYTLTVKHSASAAQTIPQGEKVLLYTTGTLIETITTTGTGTGTVTSVSVTTANGVSGSVATATTTPAITLTLGAITPSSVQVSGLTASELLATDASKNLVSLAVATYPSLTELTYVKGVTSAIQTQLNAKGIGDALTTNPLSQFAATTSAQLAGVISDETGSGPLVFAIAPTLTTPVLGAFTSTTGLMGATANFTDFPRTTMVVSTADTGDTDPGIQAIVGEAKSDGTYNAHGVDGVGATNVAGAGIGVHAVGRVTATGDTGSSFALYGSADATHAGGTNYGVYSSATNGATNYSFYGAAGLFYNAGAATFAGTVALGSNSLTMTGSLAATGARVTKGWFTDIESTNMPTVGGTAILTSLTAPQFTTIELGHATDTTISRVSAGVVAVEGNNVITANIVASPTVSGVVELATTAEIDTGTDSTRAMPVDQFVASTRNVRYIDFYLVDSATDLTVGTGKGGNFECPFTGTITAVGAYVNTAGTTNASVIDINKAGTTIMTTNKCSIDSAEVSTRTAATAPTLTTTAITAGDLISFDIDSLSTTAPKGLHVRMEIRLS